MAARPSVRSEVQPCSVMPRIVYTPSITPAVSSTAPGMSAPAPTPMPGLGLDQPQASTPVITPTGRLMRKIQCQLMRSVRTPPESRPIDPPAEATNP